MYYVSNKLVYVAVTFRGNMSVANGLAIVDISGLPAKLKDRYLGESAFVMGSAKMYSNVSDCVCVYVTPAGGEMHLRSEPTGTANWIAGNIYLDLEGIWIIP